MAKKSRLKTGFTLGGEQAEADPLAEDAFVETGTYEAIASRLESRCFLIGRTGSGKSAALNHLADAHPDHVIRINPENLSLPYITNLQAVRTLDELEVNLDPFWIALWKHVLLVEVIRHRYKVDDPESKKRFLATLRDRIRRDPGKIAALEYLDEFDGKFWCETDERVKEITERFTQKIEAEAAVSPSVGGAEVKLGGVRGTEVSREVRTELVNKYQRIVNASQVARLNKMVDVLDDEILDGPQHFTYVVVDDLDHDWVDERVANDLIRCLFRTVLELQRVRNLKVLVALRTNIFQELDFGRRSAGQEEKFRALALDLKWTRAALVEVLDERVRVASDRASIDAQTIADFLPTPNRARGNPVDYLLDRTLLRPRDAISFANACLGEAAGKPRASWEDIITAERSYSTGRLLALRDEWKSTYPGIDLVFQQFSGAPGRMDRDEFSSRLDDAMLLTADEAFPGTVWMTEMSRGLWSPGEASWFDQYQPLAALLFRVGLIGFARSGSAAPVFCSGDRHLLDNLASVETLKFAHVHRMFHSALAIRIGRDHQPESD